MPAKPIPVFAAYCTSHGIVAADWYETAAEAESACDYHNFMEHTEAELLQAELERTKDDWL